MDGWMDLATRQGTCMTNQPQNYIKHAHIETELQDYI